MTFRIVARTSDVLAECPVWHAATGLLYWVDIERGLREPLGSLHCLDGALMARRVMRDVCISNGLAWSPDGTRMYFADSDDPGARDPALEGVSVLALDVDAQGLPAIAFRVSSSVSGAAAHASR